MIKHSEACERNKNPILNILKDVFSDRKHILEIGSGTGQHAVYFGKNLRHLTWQPSDLNENISDISERWQLEGTENVKSPIEIDVTKQPWPVRDIDAVFTANTFHIMPWECASYFFKGVGKVLTKNGLLCIYGPFKYKGKFTTESNADFDKWLQNSDPKSGIRNFEDVNSLALKQGLELVCDHNMPANNQCIIWKR
ncbi:MAG: DUF938 domain-containing protein [Thermodesulfobacteriota bacterium]